MVAVSARQRAIEAVSTYRPPVEPIQGDEAPGELFGSNVFSQTVMQRRLPKQVYRSVAATIEHSEPLDPSVADIVATAMKDWAIEKGATHYAHVFYPLTGLTAEKHDSFLAPDGDGACDRRVRRQDRSSRVSPTRRASPTAACARPSRHVGTPAGTSPAPPTSSRTPTGTRCASRRVFVSWTGEALDKKTPLLRSQQALNVQAQRVLDALRPRRDRALVSSFAGAEQEYFLIDRHFFFGRPDLMASGRTLFGAPRAEGPGVRRPLLRCHPRARAGVHARRRT